MNTTNICTKLTEIRKQIGQIKKEEINEFQKFKYVSEYTYFNKINPLLQEHRLVMTFEDTDFPLNIQKEGKEWSISFQKQAIITDVETEKSLTFKFWATGQNTDIAKAKGSADTYAVKYFLQKFFMIATSDKAVLDPDAMSNEPDKKNRPLTKEEKKQVEEVLERHKLKENKKCVRCGYDTLVGTKICPGCLVEEKDQITERNHAK